MWLYQIHIERNSMISIGEGHCVAVLFNNILPVPLRFTQIQQQAKIGDIMEATAGYKQSMSNYKLSIQLRSAVAMFNTTFVGLDVHKETITIARAKGYTGNIKVYGSIKNDIKLLMKVLLKFNQVENLIVCYEASSCGYTIYRLLIDAGIECKVVALSLIPRKPGERVKNDRRDTKKLTNLLRSNELTFIWIPDRENEALRDLLRAREKVVSDFTRAKNRIKQFLLRNNIMPPEGINSWTVAYRQWLDRIQINNEAQSFVLQEYLQNYDQVRLQVKRFDKNIEKYVPTCSQKDFIKALKGFRGIDTVTSASIACEIGDIRQFQQPRKLMSYLGVIPSEHSSGNSRHQGNITKEGNTHLRRVIIEACQHYKLKPKVSYTLSKRQKGLSPVLKNISWRAQRRLHNKYWRLSGRGKPYQVVIIAIARELMGFIWETGMQIVNENEKSRKNGHVA
ncbi:MAG: IS110 family transposase [Firmicutes bacterium]|nr:IS110 family transposase [Bacillota bacterium]